MSRKESVLLQIIFAVLIVSSVFAQNPANFHLIYGNRDASPFTVTPGDTILLPIWGATDPNPNSPDSVTFMHNPLLSRNLYVEQRLGGQCEFCSDCDSCCLFTMPENMPPPNIGYTNQSMLAYVYLQDPRRDDCFIYTGGDTILLGYFRMSITSDSSYNGQTVNAFSEGFSQSNGGTLWGMQDGVRGVNPLISFSQLYFSPCVFICGDANGDGFFDGRDVGFAVNYFKGFGPDAPYTCECQGLGNPRLAADANGDCHFSGIDVTYSVNYLKGIGPAPRRCPDC